MTRARWLLLGIVLLFAIVSRVPYLPDQIFSADDVNFAYAIGHFDTRLSQPHPPGYPLFVLQMRALKLFRFHRPESILKALAVLGSLACVTALFLAGDRMLGPGGGFLAALLLVFYPSFWYAAFTSAVRVQLALISAAAGYLCWRAWRGDRVYIISSAALIGAASGIRPEAGPLLLPLWIAAAIRGRAGWLRTAGSLALMALMVVLWFVPTATASGGIAAYVRDCWGYLADQSTLTSAAFGASNELWLRSMVWLCVWTFAPVLAWTTAVFWKPSLRGEQFDWTFLALWFIPPFAFAAVAHVADPGHVLLLAPPICLVGASVLKTAADRMSRAGFSDWHVAAIALLPGSAALASLMLPSGLALLLMPVLFAIAGLLLRPRTTRYPVIFWQACTVLAVPVAVFNSFLFFTEGWYYRGDAASLWNRVRDHLYSGVAYCSYGQIRATLATDHQNLLAMREFGGDVIVWDAGPTSWRKASYYLPDTPIIVLERKSLHPLSTPVVSIRRGAELLKRVSEAGPLRVPLQPGQRVLWVLGPSSRLLAQVKQMQGVQCRFDVCLSQLSGEGSMKAGSYNFIWGIMDVW